MPNESWSLAGKSAIVTGAGRGIGRAIALAYAGAGAGVICADIDETVGEEVAAEAESAGGRARAIRCDVSSSADAEATVQAAREAFGGVDILVSCAAADDPVGSVIELDETAWNHVLAVNLTGAFLMSKAVLPEMIAKGGGSIILIASQLGRVGAPGRAVYCASKGALIQLARTMALDHAAQNIRVNSLSPGAVETQRLTRRYGDMEAVRAALVGDYPLGRLGTPEEIARTALFLASDASSFMTGSDLLADGGFTAR